PFPASFSSVKQCTGPFLSSIGSARGTVPSTVLSYSDYIARPEDQRSTLRFDRGDAERACRVLVIDDSLYEGAETFAVTLGNATGGLVRTEHDSAHVVILPHTPDEPVVYLGSSEYSVDESCSYLDVSVWRSGTDLSHDASVTLRSRSTQPVSALGRRTHYLSLSLSLFLSLSLSLSLFHVSLSFSSLTLSFALSLSLFSVSLSLSSLDLSSLSLSLSFSLFLSYFLLGILISLPSFHSTFSFPFFFLLPS
uniref:Calx-beta domain-containing protein n=1 Tax=Hucho hucho TaxID=62062 RepID=A0A4W5LJZ1_9TELE